MAQLEKMAENGSHIGHHLAMLATEFELEIFMTVRYKLGQHFLKE